MKRYIKTARGMKLPWKVVIGWDAGGPESGPIWRSDDTLIYAYSAEDAIEEAKKYYNNPSEYEDFYAVLADPEYVDEYRRHTEDPQTIGELQTWLENPDWFSYEGGPDVHKQADFERNYTSWQQVYDEFEKLGDEDAVYEFYKRGDGNPYFERAWIEWNSGSAPVESATSIRYNLPKPWYKKPMWFIKKTFGDDFIEDDRALCAQNGLEFAGYAWNYDTGDYAIVAKEPSGRYNCYFPDHSGRLTLVH